MTLFATEAQSGERLSRVYRRTAGSRTARRPGGGRRTRLEAAGPACREPSRGTPASGLGLGGDSRCGARRGAAAARRFRRGFRAGGIAVAVIAASDLLGSRAGHRMPMELTRGALEAGSKSALRIGDAVIHLEHGIGRLRGIETVVTTGVAEQEALRIEYAGGAVLMVPVGEIEPVWRYGAESERCRSTGSTARAGRSAARRSKRESPRPRGAWCALAREREAREAPKLNPPAAALRALRRRVPVRRRRADQARAIEDVLADLASGRPMDRLVCGDVGFGKTEVALRAAAAAALAGKQVAVARRRPCWCASISRPSAAASPRSASRSRGLSRLVTPAEARDGQGRAGGRLDRHRDRHARARRQGRRASTISACWSSTRSSASARATRQKLRALRPTASTS